MTATFASLEALGRVSLATSGVSNTTMAILSAIVLAVGGAVWYILERRSRSSG